MKEWSICRSFLMDIWPKLSDNVLCLTIISSFHRISLTLFSAFTEQQSLNKFSFIRHSQKYSLWAKVYSKLALSAPFISFHFIKLNFYFALLCGASKGSMKTLNTFWDAKVQNQKFKLIFFLCPRSGQEGLLIKTLE